MTFGIDIGTTSVAGVAIGREGQVAATVTIAHGADFPGCRPGVHEQDPERLMSAVDQAVLELESRTGAAERIGWTGQMHGVVGVDAHLRPVTSFVTWRDRRCFGGRVMAEWAAEGRTIAVCLPVCGLAVSRRMGRCAIDSTFLHSWHLEEVEGKVPGSWLPTLDDASMLGDNQAGVYAARRLLPGCAVVNLGTSGQLSVVEDTAFTPWSDGSVERRPYPGGKTLLCRASLVGGRVFAELKEELGLSWEEMNARAESDERILRCICGIVDDLAVGMDISRVTSLVGVGNALTRNPAIRRAVERRFGLTCEIPPVAEMAAYGAALYAEEEFHHNLSNRNGKGKDFASVEKFCGRDFVLARHEPFAGDSSFLQADGTA